MLLDFRSSLPGGFHAPLKRKVKPMDYIKCVIAIGDKTLYDMASLLCFITVGPHRQVEHQTLFDYEMCAVVPASIIDEYGCLRTGTQSTLISNLKVDDLQSEAPGIVIVDGQQLLYHFVWPCAGSASDIANIMKDKFGQYPPTEVLVIFDRYDDRSANYHKRIRRAGEGAGNYNITTSSKLLCRDVIMKSKANKKALVRILSTFNLGNNVTMVGREESMYSHDEAYIIRLRYCILSIWSWQSGAICIEIIKAVRKACTRHACSCHFCRIVLLAILLLCWRSHVLQSFHQT